MAHSMIIKDISTLPKARGPYGNLPLQPEHILLHRVCAANGTTLTIYTRGIGTRTFFTLSKPGTFNFKALPPETRNAIYRLCVAPGIVFPLPHSHEEHFGIDQRFASQGDYDKPNTALFQVDHQIREEALSIYVQENKFVIPVGDVFANTEFLPVEYLPLVRRINVAFSARDVLLIYTPMGLLLRKVRSTSNRGPSFDATRTPFRPDAYHHLGEDFEDHKLRSIWEEKARYIGATLRGLEHLEIDVAEASCGMRGLVSLGDPSSRWSQKSISGSVQLVPSECCRLAGSVMATVFADWTRRWNRPRVPPAAAVIHIHGAKGDSEHRKMVEQMIKTKNVMARCHFAPACGCCPVLGQGPLHDLTLDDYAASLGVDWPDVYSWESRDNLAFQRCVELWGVDTEQWDKVAQNPEILEDEVDQDYEVHAEAEDEEEADLKQEEEDEFTSVSEECTTTTATIDAKNPKADSDLCNHSRHSETTEPPESNTPESSEPSTTVHHWDPDLLLQPVKDFWDYHRQNELHNLPPHMEIPASFWRSDFVRHGIDLWVESSSRTEGMGLEF